MPIDERVRAILGSGPRCSIGLTGPPGSGKSTAVAHLCAALGPDVLVRIDDPVDHSNLRFEVHPNPSLRSPRKPIGAKPDATATLEMAPWTDEDLAEYLLATHRCRCRAVMLRLRADADRAALGGLPELWRIVLDEMAADDAVCTIDAALLRFLARGLSDPGLRAAAEHRALAALTPWAIEGDCPPPRCDDPSIKRMVRHERVCTMIAAHRLVAGLEDGSTRACLCERLPLTLVQRIATLCSDAPLSLKSLDALMREPAPGAHAMAASILHAAAPGWQPRGSGVPNLSEAWLAGIKWEGIGLPGCRMNGADLRGAELPNADLLAAVLDGANLSGATLRNAWLRAASLKRADLAGANLAGATADDADFCHCNLQNAILAGASLRGALFRRADLTGAAFRRADLSEADFAEAMIEAADFTGASLVNARLPGLSFGGCTFGAACLRGADLARSNLEGLIADGMDFEKATLNDAFLTGSVLRSARFVSARLLGCRLAEVDWEGADLRDADLRGSAFHLGTTRSGLVGSTVPCEGSRTGYYTDEFYDASFKSPEEVRKANLRGADLRGANFDNVDFYLVDLRDARYSADQGEWLRRCGAILGT